MLLRERDCNIIVTFFQHLYGYKNVILHRPYGYYSFSTAYIFILKYNYWH